LCQVVDNACATLAVLNIALNNPQMEIGDDLREFKEFTKDFSPPVCFLFFFFYYRELVHFAKINNLFRQKVSRLRIIHHSV